MEIIKKKASFYSFMVNEGLLRKGFQRIKRDMQVLHQRDEFTATEMSNLRTEFNTLKDEIHNQSFIEKIANSIIEKIEARLETAETNNKEVVETAETIDEKEPETPETAETRSDTVSHNPIPNQIDSSIFLKRKIKAKIVNLCEQRVSPGDLKRAIVDLAKLCSKATFYRYVSELKRDGIIQAIEINNEAFLLASEAILDKKNINY